MLGPGASTRGAPADLQGSFVNTENVTRVPLEQKPGFPPTELKHNQNRVYEVFS